jgi:hypothetical protein
MCLPRDLVVYVEMKLKPILKKPVFKILGILSWLRLRTSRAGSFEQGRNSVGVPNSGEFLELLDNNNNNILEKGCFLLPRKDNIFTEFFQWPLTLGIPEVAYLSIDGTKAQFPPKTWSP